VFQGFRAVLNIELDCQSGSDYGLDCDSHDLIASEQAHHGSVGLLILYLVSLGHYTTIYGMFQVVVKINGYICIKMQKKLDKVIFGIIDIYKV